MLVVWQVKVEGDLPVRSDEFFVTFGVETGNSWKVCGGRTVATVGPPLGFIRSTVSSLDSCCQRVSIEY